MISDAPGVELPELGPLLGRMLSPPAERTPVEAALDQIRLDLLTELFDRARAARDFLALDDAAGARSALGGSVWRGVWDRAVASASATVIREIEQRLREAAAVSRYPAKRLARSLPDAEARRLLAARLSAAGIGLEEASERLSDSARPWPEILRRVSGELEASWNRLLAAAGAELAGWEPLAAAIRSWRRPWRPLLVVSGVLLLIALWLGLVLGGFLAAPGWLRPLTSWVWNL